MAVPNPTRSGLDSFIPRVILLSGAVSSLKHFFSFFLLYLDLLLPCDCAGRFPCGSLEPVIPPGGLVWSQPHGPWASSDPVSTGLLGHVAGAALGTLRAGSARGTGPPTGPPQDISSASKSVLSFLPVAPSGCTSPGPAWMETTQLALIPIQDLGCWAGSEDLGVGGGRGGPLRC